MKHCTSLFAPIFIEIFNYSIALCRVPACFKSSVIVPISKKGSITSLNDYRRVALTSVVMKCFERLVLSHLKTITNPHLDPLQFAHRPNCSVDDAVNLSVYSLSIPCHLDTPGPYARVLFVDISSAFNTIVPQQLHSKLLWLEVDASICQ